MMRLTAYASGNVQKVGYRARIAQIANSLKLKGIVENLSDGRVKIVAEGDEQRLRWFEEAIDRLRWRVDTKIFITYYYIE